MADQNIDSLQIEIESSSSEAEESLDRLVKSLQDLNKTLTKVGNTMSSSMGSASKSMNTANQEFSKGKVLVDALYKSASKLGGATVTGIKNLVSQFTQLGRAKNDISGLTTNVKTLLATLIGFRGITGLFNWTKEAVTAGADLTEIDHIVESVFGENMIGYVQDWAANSIEAFGIAGTEAKRYAGTLSAMFQASNVGVKESNKMSMELVKLAGDLSAFYNIDTETAYNKLKSGMAGMVRPLRDLGIDLSVATLKEYALAQGIDKSYSSMSQAEKMMLRYQYLMSQTGKQQGDFALTSASLANSMRILKAYTSEITIQIGVGFAAALRHAIVALNKLMQYILKASQAFATFMQTLFGKYKGGTKGALLDGSLLDADVSAGDLAESAGNAADGLADADEEAKKLKKDLAVLPFDELNQLAKDRETSTSTKGGTGGGSIGNIGDIGDFGDGLFSDAIDNVEERLGKFQDFVDRWARLIKGYFEAKNWEGLGKAIAWGFNQGIDALYKILDPTKAAEKINPFLDAFTTTFNSFVDEIHWEKLGGDIGEGITILVNAFNRILDPETGVNFTKIGNSLGSLLMGAIRNIKWRSVGNLISNKFMSGWRIFAGFVEKLDAKDIGNAIHETIGGAIEKFEPEEIGASLGSFVTKVADAIKTGFGDKEQWETLGEKLGHGINAFLENFDGKDAAEGINALLDALFTTIGSMLSTTSTGQLMIDIGEFIGNLDWGKIATIAAILAVPTFIPALVGGLIKQALFKSLLKAAITKPLAEAMTEVGTASEVTTASSGMFTGIKSALIGEGIGAGVMQGGVYAAIVAVIGKFAELQDAMKGGNGIITEVGGAFDSYINQLYTAGLITGDTKDKLFDLKEQMESDKITSEQFGTEFSKALQDSGISAETASGQVDTLASKMGNLTDTQIESLKSAVSQMTSTYESHNKALEAAGLNGEEAFNKIRNAINMADPDIIEHGQTAQKTFDEAYKQSGGDAIEAMGAVINKWKEMDLEPELLKTAIDENLGEGTYDALVTDASTTAESVNGSLDTISSKVGDTKSSVQTDLSSMRGEMTDLHKTAGTSAEEIGKSQGNVSFFMLLLSQAVTTAMGVSKKAVEEKTKEMRDSMDETANSAEENGNAIPTNLGESIEEKSSVATDAVSDMASAMKMSFTDNFDASAMIDEAFDNLDSICTTVSGYGESIAEALRGGIESIDISIPHIEWAGTYTRIWTGANSYTDIPDYDVRWYANGGLFTRATIAGFGEAGDEAALPLENRRTMNRIANAIVDSSGGSMGMDEESISAAIARGYVQAMMSNQGNERPMNVYATLYTEDNEVLARAVQKGNQSIDYRNNATARY